VTLTSTDTATLRDRAASVVADVAGRLADQAGTIATASAPENDDRFYPGQPHSPWAPESLGNGHAGIALLFAELAAGSGDTHSRGLAHAQLRAAANGALPTGAGLYRGAAGLGFSVAAFARQVGGYATTLNAIDTVVDQRVDKIVAEEDKRLRNRNGGTRFDAYDVITGLSGMGAYLLHRGAPARDTLRTVLAYLVRLTGSTTEVDGQTVRGWCVDHGPRRDERAPHLNLGMAHGISGPLALLALAHRAGIHVPGDEQAIEHIAGVLLDLRRHDAAGPYWPSFLFQDGSGTQPPERGRDAWCYGALGMARSLQLAAGALGRDDWSRVAGAAARGALSNATDARVGDASLCHGWAGILQLAWQIRQDDPGAVPTALMDRLAAAVLDQYAPEVPFGFRYDVIPGVFGPDRPAILDGAAGVALALHTYASDTAPHTGWDRVLLVA
jgi:lantibiotic biosynthesis protein